MLEKIEFFLKSEQNFRSKFGEKIEFFLISRSSERYFSKFSKAYSNTNKNIIFSFKQDYSAWRNKKPNKQQR